MQNVARRRLNVLLVGLGRAASLAFEALSQRNDIAVVAAVDPSPAPRLDPGSGVPRWPSLEEVRLDVVVDLAIVSVPTPAHVSTCRSLLDSELRVATLLCEKPLATDADEVQSLLEHALQRGVELRVLYHYAHAVEVDWAAANVEELVREHGDVVQVRARFADRYGDRLDDARRALDSSWVDSGINALSVLARVRQPAGVHAAEVTPERARVEVRLEGGAPALVETEWVAQHEVKRTRFDFEDGVRLTLDHLSQRASLDDVTQFAGADGTDVRLDRYRRMLAAQLDRAADVLDGERTLTLHRLLHDARRLSGAS